MFAAVSDAVARTLVRVVQMKVDELPTLPRPTYLPSETARPVSRAAGRAQMNRLIRMGRRPAKRA
jgi:hypothetical protein